MWSACKNSYRFIINLSQYQVNLRTCMMSTAEIDKLRGRAEAAEQLISDLRVKITEIKDNYAKGASQGIEEKLLNENVQLKNEIAALKLKLQFVEVRNGVKQIPLPTNGPTPAAAAPTAQAAPNQSAPATKKEKKPKKKEGAGDAAKKAAADDKPVDVSRLDLRVGLIEAVEKHPDADTLYVETVNVGEADPRTIVSGLVKHVSMEQLLHKKAIFMCNLKPAKMRGVESQGMIMCASCPDAVELIDIPQDASPGQRITVAEFPGEPDELLAPKKKIWEQVAPDLKIDDKGVATYKGAPFRLNGQVVCKAPTLKNVQIK